jgi:SWIM zinc finger
MLARGGLRDWRSPDVAGKLRKNLARLLLESLHRLDIRNRPLAHAGDTQFRELVVRRDALHNHDVDRQRRFLCNPTDMVGRGQPGNEEAGRARRRVSDLLQRGDRLTAEVEGSEFEPYQVSIRLHGDGVADAQCTCPYDWDGYCKHILAVLLKFADEKASIIKRKPIAELLAELDQARLRPNGGICVGHITISLESKKALSLNAFDLKLAGLIRSRSGKLERARDPTRSGR